MQATSYNFVIREKMLGKHIQLPFGVVRDKNKKKSIKLNLPPNFRKDVLFDQVSYLSRLENPAIVNVVKNSIVDYYYYTIILYKEIDFFGATFAILNCRLFTSLKCQ